MRLLPHAVLSFPKSPTHTPGLFRTFEALPPMARPAPPRPFICIAPCEMHGPARGAASAGPAPGPAPSFRLARAEWAERAVLSGGAAGGVHWLPSTRPSVVSGLFAMDHDGVSLAPRASFRTFLEHLSGAGKAIGVLTSGGDAQGALPPPRGWAEGDIGEKGWRYGVGGGGGNVGTRASDRGTGRREMWESSPVPGAAGVPCRVGAGRAAPSHHGGAQGGEWQPKPSSGRSINFPPPRYFKHGGWRRGRLDRPCRSSKSYW